MKCLAVQEYFDPPAWKNEVRFGRGLPDRGILRNVPCRGTRLDLPWR